MIFGCFLLCFLSFSNYSYYFPLFPWISGRRGTVVESASAPGVAQRGSDADRLGLPSFTTSPPAGAGPPTGAGGAREIRKNQMVFAVFGPVNRKNHCFFALFGKLIFRPLPMDFFALGSVSPGGSWWLKAYRWMDRAPPNPP